jgi:uncharacterized protein YdcH (DUF465 family)
MLQDRIKSLQTKHKELDNRINELYKHNNTDNEITVLKKQKLQVKQELTKIKQNITGEQNG